MATPLAGSGITMPLGGRPAGQDHDAIGNLSRLATVTAGPPDGDAGYRALVSDVARQTRYAKQNAGPQVDPFCRALAAAWCPAALKHRACALPCARSAGCDTSLISNLGNLANPPRFGPAATSMWFSTSAAHAARPVTRRRLHRRRASSVLQVPACAVRRDGGGTVRRRLRHGAGHAHRRWTGRVTPVAYAGIPLALLATTAYNSGLILEKRALERLPAIDVRRAFTLARIVLTAPQWLAGFSLMLCGLAFQVVVLTFEPVTVVQPVLACGVVVVILLSRSSCARTWVAANSAASRSWPSR